jgi:hypothetical protein
VSRLASLLFGAEVKEGAMRAFPVSLFALCLGAVGASGADRKDQLFASWQQAQRSAKSLVIEFTQETWEPNFNKRETFYGIVRLIRTPKGEVFASEELTTIRPKPEKQDRMRCLLNNGIVYVLNHDEKSALGFEVPGSELMPFLERNFNPFVVLLDRKRAEEKCHIEVVKQDESYTYLAVKQIKVKRTGWFPDNFHEGRVVLMNKASERVPKDMPRQLWYTDGSREITFEIKSWRLNAGEAPKLEEFTKPQGRPGWRVNVWPWQGEK